MSSKMQNLIVRIATKAIKVDKELYKVVDEFYLGRTEQLPSWAKNRIHSML